MKSCVASEVPEQPHVIILYVKLDHIQNILPQTGCPAKFAFSDSTEAQSGRSRLFSALSGGFSNITAEPLILEQKIVYLNLAHIERYLSHFWEGRCDNFTAELLRKTC